MNKFLFSLFMILTSATAFAYGPPSKILVESNYNCRLETNAGEVLNAKLIRRLWDIRRKPGTRMLISELKLADGTGFETGTGNLDVLLAPHFGRARYDESMVSVSIENITGDSTLQMAPLKPFYESTKHAWAADSQDDLLIVTGIEGGQDSLATNVVFAIGSKSVSFAGTCLAD